MGTKTVSSTRKTASAKGGGVSAKAGSASARPKAASKPSPAKGRKGGEAVLARVEAVRLAQRQEGNFDCFATAKGGYCDQSDCLYLADCLDISQRL